MSIFTKGPPFDLTRHHVALDALRVEVTFFPNQYAMSITSVESLTLRDLADRIQNTSGPTKDKLPWLKLATFGNLKSDVGCLRHNANVVAINGVEGDYDGEVITLDAAVAIAERVNLHALFYTSASHTDAAPRWRILVPCSRPMPPVMRALLLARVNGIYDGVLSPESFTLSQAYYFGSGGNPAHRAVVVEGDCIDLRPDLDATAINKVATNGHATEHTSNGNLLVTLEVATAAAAVIPNPPESDRNYWVRVGMAFHGATGGSVEGLDLFDAWSKLHPTYNARHTKIAWRGFHPTSIGAGTLIHMANEADPDWRIRHDTANIKHGAAVAHNVMPSLRLIEDDPRHHQTDEEQNHGGIVADKFMPSRLVRRAQGPLSGVPRHLLEPPGWLGEIVKYYNATAPKSQPQFAVSTALAVVSVLASRFYCTDQNNYASIYQLNVSNSATGKEHAKTVVEHLLEAADLERFIGPSGYTSAAGVLSTLVQQPQHIAVIDELGRMLQSAHAIGNAYKTDAITMLMKAFGSQGTTLRPEGYSTHGMSGKQIEEFYRNRAIRRPANSLLAMTTPRSLFENLSSHYITDGFLARFIIVQSDLPREVSNYTSAVSVPADLVEWMQTVARADSDITEGVSLRDKAGGDVVPPPITIPFAVECRTILRAYERELLDQMNILDKSRMESMLGRTKEMAQRVALIVAISCEAETVEPEHLQWAIDYVNFYAQQAIARLRENVSDGPFQMLCQMASVAIRKAGGRGLTKYELARQVSKFANLEERRRGEVLQILVSDYDVVRVVTQTGGRPREAWAARIDTEIE